MICKPEHREVVIISRRLQLLLKICFVTISKRKLLINETIKKINSKLNTLHEGPITSSHRFKGHFLTLKASHTQNCWHILSTLVCLFNQPITQGLLWHSHNHVNKLVVLLHMAINYCITVSFCAHATCILQNFFPWEASCVAYRYLQQQADMPPIPVPTM